MTDDPNRHSQASEMELFEEGRERAGDELWDTDALIEAGLVRGRQTL